MKKLSVILAMLMVISVAFAFTSCKSKEYKDTVVTVTDDQGKAVKDENGNPVTVLATQIDESTTAQNDTDTATTKNSETTKKGETTKKNSTTKKGETTKKNTTTKKGETTKKSEETTTETTTVPSNRQLNISVVLPSFSNREDTLIFNVDGKEVAKKKINLNGTTYSFTTEDKYKGDIDVVVTIKDYNSTGSAKIKKGADSCTISLEGIETLDGEDD